MQHYLGIKTRLVTEIIKKCPKYSSRRLFNLTNDKLEEILNSIKKGKPIEDVYQNGVLYHLICDDNRNNEFLEK